MSRIELLPDYLAHKIAAGEVVERPISVVKELVENSIDALATNIEIEIIDGGKEYIRVSDNGTGIHPEDLEIAFMRHATSKIHSVDELFAINTLGFRGEALASIASISDLTLKSRQSSEQSGAQIVFFNELPPIIEPVGMAPGTTIEVRRLFFNTPARYKFLKQSATERRYIVDFIAQIAVAYPSIAFKLVADQKVAVRTYGQGNILEAMQSVYDHKTIKNMIKVDVRTEWGHVGGYLAAPDISRGNRQGQFLLVNGRIIRNQMITSAVERAYHGMLEQRKFPVFILAMKIEPTLVDVNVHPAKAEVRFQTEQNLYQDILTACRETLLSKDLTRELKTNSTLKRTAHMTANQTKPDYQSLFPWQPKTWDKVDLFMQKHKKQPLETTEVEIKFAPIELTKQIEQSKPIQPTQQPIMVEERYETKEVQPSTDQSSINFIRDQLLNARIIGQFRQSYVLLETDSGLWILDQHIIHERIIYEQLAKADYKPVVQQVLPLTLEFSTTESHLIVEHLSQLQTFGVELESFGQNTFLLRGLPHFLAHGEQFSKGDILGLISDIEKNANWHDALITNLACKGAIKAGKRLNEQQIHQLLAQLAKTDNPFTCPHGRPIIVRLDDNELIRRFGR